ncbi:MAG: hypothetical protein ACOYNN_18280 [Terrimicrobiaceae bacterium]
MDDKATAAKIISNHLDNATTINELESAIVAALEAARREGIDKGRSVGVPLIGRPLEPTSMRDEDHPNDWVD